MNKEELSVVILQRWIDKMEDYFFNTDIPALENLSFEDFMVMFAEEMANRYLDNHRTHTDEWIRVEERIPEQKERVLAFDNGGFGVVSARIIGRSWYLEGEKDIHAVVTHWKPLPGPPKC